MLVIRGRNVEENYAQGLYHIRDIGSPSDSRAGAVLVAPYPVMTVYEKPTERVLLDPNRRANPFFHLMESLWMLAGRADAVWLDTYIKDFSARFGEPNTVGIVQHGAYGWRWRKHFGEDQLKYVIEALGDNPDDRRVVISMWDPEADLGATSKKDLPCNTHIYPRIVNGHLDLTVCCRSNDIIWGAYGANAVHFSVLQEYLAGRIGVRVGRLYQLSNNWHAYLDSLEKVVPAHGQVKYEANYLDGKVASRPMGEKWDMWDNDLMVFMQWHHSFWEDPFALTNNLFTKGLFYNKWFAEVAQPMARTWWAYKKKDAKINPRLEAAEIQASDWRAAALMWLDGAMKKNDWGVDR